MRVVFSYNSRVFINIYQKDEVSLVNHLNIKRFGFWYTMPQYKTGMNNNINQLITIVIYV